MNIGNYFIGVAVGVLYFNFKKENKNISKSFVSDIVTLAISC